MTSWFALSLNHCNEARQCFTSNFSFSMCVASCGNDVMIATMLTKNVFLIKARSAVKSLSDGWAENATEHTEH